MCRRHRSAFWPTTTRRFAVSWGFEQASIVDGKLLVAGTIAPTTDAARQIIELARSGFQFQASVGVAPGEWKRVRAGDIVEVNGRKIRATVNGFTLVSSSALKEVSIVAIGADAGTSVAIAASPEGEEALMTTTEKTAEDIRVEAATETERITAIRRACNGEHGEIKARAIREGWTEQQTELAVLRASRPRGPYIPAATVAPTRDVIEATVLVHMGHENLVEKHLGSQTAQQARDLRATSLA